jgi:hypothetical protein
MDKRDLSGLAASPYADFREAGVMTNLWCGERNAVKAARVQDPEVELIPCRESACKEYRGEEPFCNHMFRSKKRRNG